MSEQTEKDISPKKKWKLNVPLLIIEFLILVVAIGVLYVITTMTKEIERTDIDTANIVINEEVVETKTDKKEEALVAKSKGYRNIALFGVDARDGSLGKGNRTDTIIIASINQDTHEIKLVSVYRDTYLNLGNDTYNKCNGAYAKGGPEQAITMLNMNLDMDITDYVTVGFSGLIEAIDALGGIEIEITEAEINHLNNYQLCMAEEMGVDYTPVTEVGKQTLNGMQATAYCRIRYTRGDDFRRAERQRDVLGAMMIKAKGAPLATLQDVVTSVLPSVNTSLKVNEIISVLGAVADYNVVASEGFPFESERTNATIGSKGDCIIPLSLEENVAMLHELLYEGKSYTPSKQVISLSEEIAAQTEEYIP
ncbi:MAG: LCP family protein [Bacillus sp. (in: Bacteria)]|nr:LCP family protein [Bacillus sp. (in: firmicutes)]MCM1425712.1 LCP family protein [Eubacterium sp.]